MAAGRAELTPAEHYDGRGQLRLSAPRADFGQLIRTAFDEIRHYGKEIPTISRSLDEALDTIESAVNPARRPTVAAARQRLHAVSRSSTELAR